MLLRMHLLIRRPQIYNVLFVMFPSNFQSIVNELLSYPSIFQVQLRFFDRIVFW
jgi:hypothetical protein